MQKIRVLVVDDHTIVRDGICALLALAGDIEVVGEAVNGNEALKMVAKLQPDVVLMDIAMPIMGGLEATRRVRKNFPGTKVLALTQYDDSEYVIPIIEAGASGFVTKMSAFSELAAAIEAAHKGESYLSSTAATALVEEYQQKTVSEGEQDPYQQLTDREREVLKLVSEGKSSQEIADLLFISVRTAEHHRANLKKKLDIHRTAELTKYAIRKGYTLAHI